MVGVHAAAPVRQEHLRADRADVPRQPGSQLIGAVQEPVGLVVVDDHLGTDAGGEGVRLGDLLLFVLGHAQARVTPLTRGQRQEHGGSAVEHVLRQQWPGGEVHVADVGADGEDRSGSHAGASVGRVAGE